MSTEQTNLVNGDAGDVDTPETTETLTPEVDDVRDEFAKLPAALPAEMMDYIIEEENLAKLVRFKEAMIRQTVGGDWVIYGGTVLLQSSGVERVGAPLGFVWESSEPGSKPELLIMDTETGEVQARVQSGKPYTLLYQGWCFLVKYPDRRVFVQGRAYSDDGLLVGKAKRENRKVRFQDVADKALANFKRRCGETYFGLKNPPLALLEICGINVADLRVIEFKEGEEQQQDREKKEQSGQEAKADIDALTDAVKSICQRTNETESQVLKRLTEFQGENGLVYAQTYSKLVSKPKWLAATLDKAMKELQSLSEHL